MFGNAAAFNQVSKWDAADVDNMGGVCAGASATSSLRPMEHCAFTGPSAAFSAAAAFNQATASNNGRRDRQQRFAGASVS